MFRYITALDPECVKRAVNRIKQVGEEMLLCCYYKFWYFS
jgi:hypothetical protein